MSNEFTPEFLEDILKKTADDIILDAMAWKQIIRGSLKKITDINQLTPFIQACSADSTETPLTRCVDYIETHPNQAIKIILRTFFSSIRGAFVQVFLKSERESENLNRLISLYQQSQPIHSGDFVKDISLFPDENSNKETFIRLLLAYLIDPNSNRQQREVMVLKIWTTWLQAHYPNNEPPYLFSFVKSFLTDLNKEDSPLFCTLIARVQFLRGIFLYDYRALLPKVDQKRALDIKRDVIRILLLDKNLEFFESLLLDAISYISVPEIFSTDSQVTTGKNLIYLYLTEYPHESGKFLLNLYQESLARKTNKEMHQFIAELCAHNSGIVEKFHSALMWAYCDSLFGNEFNQNDLYQHFLCIQRYSQEYEEGNNNVLFTNLAESFWTKLDTKIKDDPNNESWKALTHQAYEFIANYLDVNVHATVLTVLDPPPDSAGKMADSKMKKLYQAKLEKFLRDIMVEIHDVAASRGLIDLPSFYENPLFFKLLLMPFKKDPDLFFECLTQRPKNPQHKLERLSETLVVAILHHFCITAILININDGHVSTEMFFDYLKKIEETSVTNSLDCRFIPLEGGLQGYKEMMSSISKYHFLCGVAVPTDTDRLTHNRPIGPIGPFGSLDDYVECLARNNGKTVKIYMATEDESVILGLLKVFYDSKNVKRINEIQLKFFHSMIGHCFLGSELDTSFLWDQFLLIGNILRNYIERVPKHEAKNQEDVQKDLVFNIMAPLLRSQASPFALTPWPNAIILLRVIEHIQLMNRKNTFPFQRLSDECLEQIAIVMSKIPMPRSSHSQLGIAVKMLTEWLIPFREARTQFELALLFLCHSNPSCQKSLAAEVLKGARTYVSSFFGSKVWNDYLRYQKVRTKPDLFNATIGTVLIDSEAYIAFISSWNEFQRREKKGLSDYWRRFGWTSDNHPSQQSTDNVDANTNNAFLPPTTKEGAF